MKFKDIFSKYINNEANEKEIKYIENEIEKVEIINDYLADKLEDELNLSGNNLSFIDDSPSIKSESDNTLKEVKKAINKKLLNVGLISGCSVVALLLSAKFIISPIMNKVYYNPMDNIDGSSNRISVDLETLSELHFGGIANSQVFAEPLGFGKYDINIIQDDYVHSDNNRHKATLNKNKFIADDNFYKYIPINIFTRGTYPFYQFPSEQDTDDVNKLKNLPDYVNTKVIVSFKEDLSISNVLNTLKDIDLSNNWIAVRCFPLDTQNPPLTGFVAHGTGAVFSEEGFDTKKYPYFDLGWADFNNVEITPEILEIHFKSMLRYMADNKEFDKTDILFSNSNSFYKEALDYVEKNGVKSYGMIVSGKPSEILKLRENPMVEQIYIDDLFLK